jgi:hypothetical protein
VCCSYGPITVMTQETTYLSCLVIVVES